MPNKHADHHPAPAIHHGEATLESLRRSASHRRWPMLLAVALGTTILLGVGFGAGALHSAAHDTRHSIGFPCH